MSIAGLCTRSVRHSRTLRTRSGHFAGIYSGQKHTSYSLRHGLDFLDLVSSRPVTKRWGLTHVNFNWHTSKSETDDAPRTIVNSAMVMSCHGPGKRLHNFLQIRATCFMFPQLILRINIVTSGTRSADRRSLSQITQIILIWPAGHVTLLKSLHLQPKLCI